MIILIWLGVALALSYFWIRGNCIAWVLVGAMSFWLAQMFLQTPTDTGFDIAFRGLWVFLLAGIPMCVWGDLARANIKRRERRRKPFIYVDLPPEDYSEYR